MDINFNPDLQYLNFKQVYLETNDIISVYKGGTSPSYVIDPLNTTQEEMIYYWTQGLKHIFDIFDK